MDDDEAFERLGDVMARVVADAAPMTDDDCRILMQLVNALRWAAHGEDLRDIPTQSLRDWWGG